MKAEDLWWASLKGADIDVNTAGLPPYDVELVAAKLDIPLTPGSRVLDLGCGVGRLTVEFARLHPHLDVHGVDVGVNMIANAAHAPNVFYDLCDGRTVPFPDEHFAAAYAVTLFQHLPGDVVRGYLREVHRVLIKGAQFAFTFAEGDIDHFLNHQVDLSDMMNWVYDAGFVGTFWEPDDETPWSWAYVYKR